jgi:hypothetical protein
LELFFEKFRKIKFENLALIIYFSSVFGVYEDELKVVRGVNPL